VGSPTRTWCDPCDGDIHRRGEKEIRMNEHLNPVAPSDFAGAERKEPLTAEEQQEQLLEGDFASGQRTKPLTEEEILEASHHGDFAGGERTGPPEESVEGSFAPSSK
jgi:hypothetical protein